MKNKKRLLVLALFLFAVIALGGYGAYSYYFTQGTFDTGDPSDEGSDSNVINIDGSFKPETRDNYNSSSTEAFLGNGGTLVLICPESSSGKETIECTGNVEVKNSGSTRISVEVENAHGYAEDTTDSGISVTPGSPSFNWTSKNIESGDSYDLTVTLPVTINNGTTGGLDSDTAEEVHAPVSGGSVQASVDFKIEATQSH